MKPIAREFRHEPTVAESNLWRALRSGAGGKAKFRRQHPIGSYIVDFYCDAAKLVIEVDGPIHLGQQERDADRQAYLEMLGLTVLRFTNDDVLRRLPKCLEASRLLVDGPS
jgi:very-short-patch-repair endonuclease